MDMFFLHDIRARFARPLQIPTGPVSSAVKSDVTEKFWHYFELQNRTALQNFVRYCLEEYEEINLLGLIAAWSLERAPSRKKARYVYDTFLQPGIYYTNVSGGARTAFYSCVNNNNILEIKSAARNLKSFFLENVQDCLQRYQENPGVIYQGSKDKKGLLRFRSGLSSMRSAGFLLPASLEGF